MDNFLKSGFRLGKMVSNQQYLLHLSFELFIFKDFIHLFDGERASTSRGSGRQREKQAPR